MRRVLARLSGFMASAIINAIATLLSIYFIIGLHGDKNWAVFAVGQAIGMLVAVAVGFGWAVIGPATVAPLSSEERVVEYRIALRVRLVLAAVVGGICLVVIGIPLIPGFQPALPVALAYTLTGLTSLWYFVGTGQAWAAVICETLPRATGVVAAPFVALLGPTQPLLAVSIAAGLVVGVVMSRVKVGREGRGLEALAITGDRVRQAIARQRHGMVSAGVSATYLTLPVIVVSAVAPSATAAFALGDKMVKLAGSALLPITQVVQGWVPRSTPEARPATALRAVKIMGTVGVVAGVGLAALAPIIGGLLSGSSIELAPLLAIPMGVILACTITSQCTGTACLGAFGDYRGIAQSAVVGAIVGVALLFVLTPAWGGLGAMWSVAAAELTVVGWQLVRLSRHVRRAN